MRPGAGFVHAGGDAAALADGERDGCGAAFPHGGVCGGPGARRSAPRGSDATGALEFGGIERVKEEGRAARGANLIDNLVQDLRYGLRMPAQESRLYCVTVLTLALGIGRTAIFGLVDSAFLRAYLSRTGALVHIWTIEDDGDMHTPTPMQYLRVGKRVNPSSKLRRPGGRLFLRS